MTNILDIIPYKVLPAQMGGQKGIAIFCKYLGAKNNLTAVSVNDNDINAAENYSMIPLFSKVRLRYMNPFYISAINKIVKEKSIKNVITEHPYMAWMGWWLKRKLGIKWFVHSHNIEFERFRTLDKSWFKLLKIYEKWSYKNADGVFFKTNEDIQFAVENKMVKKQNAVLVPFGVELEKMPADIFQQKQKIYARHKIPAEAKLFLFNGALAYKPNTDALQFILDEINPLLLQHRIFDYRILICGKGLPSQFNNLEEYADKNIICTGFVEDVIPYFKAADIFINPVTSGGGVKTKIVEAMGYGVTVVSGTSGAAGIESSACGKKIIVVPDNDANAFATEIFNNTKQFINTPDSYYQYYFWGNIIKKIQPLFSS